MWSLWVLWLWIYNHVFLLWRYFLEVNNFDIGPSSLRRTRNTITSDLLSLTVLKIINVSFQPPFSSSLNSNLIYTVNIVPKTTNLNFKNLYSLKVLLAQPPYKKYIPLLRLDISRSSWLWDRPVKSLIVKS